jgi:hypothetical protein
MTREIVYADGDVRTVTVFDRPGDHYRLVAAGIAPERIVLVFHPNGPLRYSDAVAA